MNIGYHRDIRICKILKTHFQSRFSIATGILGGDVLLHMCQSSRSSIAYYRGRSTIPMAQTEDRPQGSAPHSFKLLQSMLEAGARLQDCLDHGFRESAALPLCILQDWSNKRMHLRNVNKAPPAQSTLWYSTLALCILVDIVYTASPHERGVFYTVGWMRRSTHSSQQHTTARMHKRCLNL